MKTMFDKAKVVPQIQLEVREIAAILALVQEEMGITIIPAMALPPQLPTGLKTLHLRPTAWRHLALAVPSREKSLPPQECFSNKQNSGNMPRVY